MTYTFDPAEVTRGLEKLAPPAFAIRALECRQYGKWRSGTLEGFFTRDNIPAVLSMLQTIEFAVGVYFTPHEIKQDILFRNYNKFAMVEGKKSYSVGDEDMIRRKWLLVDVDSNRTAGISATAAEKEYALRTITDVDYWLWEQGFPPGVIVDSGNGAHLYIPLEMPADETSTATIKGLLHNLAAEFDNEHAHIDTQIYNAARIMRLPGTMACKGDHVPQFGREWRVSKIIRDCREAN